MSDQPPDYGWSLPPKDNRASPPPSPAESPQFAPPQFAPTQAAPTSTPIGPPGSPDPTVAYRGPLTANELNAIAPAPIPEPPPAWKQRWFIGAVVIAILGVAAFVYANSREDDARDTLADTRATSEEVTIPDFSVPDFTVPDLSVPDLSIPTFTIPELSIPEFTIPALTVPGLPIVPPVPGSTTPLSVPSGALPATGETATFPDGTVVRLNSVTPDAPPVQDLFPLEDGFSLTRLDYEACAGPNGFASLNPIYWTGSLDDGTSAEVFLFSFDIIILQLAPGGCVLGQVDIKVPSGRSVVTVGIRDTAFLAELHWSTTSSVPVTGPLASADAVAATPVGEPVTLANDATVTVRSITPNSEPLDPFFPADEGRQLVRIDVEVCAGSVNVAVEPQNFFVVTTDSQIGRASYFGSTLEATDLAAGQCASGMIDLIAPADAAPSDVVLSNELTVEVARWRVG